MDQDLMIESPMLSRIICCYHRAFLGLSPDSNQILNIDENGKEHLNPKKVVSAMMDVSVFQL